MFQSTIHLDTHYNVGPIDRRIFGGFAEHLGRCIYEGIYDPGSPLSDEHGFRRDVIDALRKLNMPVMRYPGGNFVSAYQWRDGIGPKQSRPARPDFAWSSIESNQFGTDEFMRWARIVGTEPMLAVNLGTAGPSQAAELLEYCNLDTQTSLAQLRKANGHPEPYKVKYWCLGNEMDGPWQAGHCTAIEYARRAWQTSRLMKGLDNSIQTIICGSSARGMNTYMEWDRTIVEECWDTADYISAHRYSNNDRNDTAWFLAEGVEIDRILEDYSGLLSYVRGLKRSDRRMYLSFDEWNVWYRQRGGHGEWKQAPHLLEEVYNLEDAIVCAQYLTGFLRHADLVKMACIAQVVNVIAPILTNKNGLLIQTIFHPFELISNRARGHSLTPAIGSPHYRAGERGDVPSIDAAASFDPQTGEAAIFVINRQINEEAHVRVTISDRCITGVIDGEQIGGQDPKLSNTWQMPDAVKRFDAPAKIVDGGAAEFVVKAPGFAAIRLSTRAR